MRTRNMAAFLLLAVVLSLVCAGCGQEPVGTGAIEGWVMRNVDAKGASAGAKQPMIVMGAAPKVGSYVGLDGARVLVERSGRQYVGYTDTGGYFRIGGLRAGTYSVTITHARFLDSYRTWCDVRDGQTTGIGARTLGSLHILVIGINNYTAPVNPLQYATPDAEYFHQVLGQENNLAKQVVLLTDEQATRSGIESAIRSMGEEIFPGDTFMMFYSGHGAQSSDGRTEYIVPQDYNGSSSSLISDAQLNALVDVNIYADHCVFVFDSCHSGGMYKAASAWLPKGFTRSTGFEVMAKNLSSRGFIVITACDKDEVSWEDSQLGHGVFTYQFVGGMREPGYYADGAFQVGPRDGEITTEEAFRYAEYYVNDWMNRNPGKVQTPTIYRGLSGAEVWGMFRY